MMVLKVYVPGGTIMARKKPKPRSKIKPKITQRHADTPKKIPFMLALADKMLGEIGFVDLMDESVEWDKKQCHVSPGNHLKAIILSTFMSGLRSPLCNIGEKYETMDTEYLFGENVEPEHLNDHAIGRSLDKLAIAGPEKLFGSLALSAYGWYNIAFNRLHSDTTNVSFYEDYDTDTTE